MWPLTVFPLRGRSQRGSELFSRDAFTNLMAQGLALGSASVASVLVARVGGPAIVGEWALLRVLPWLLGVIVSCGLPTASAYFLAGDEATDRRLKPTLCLMLLVSAAISAIGWLLLSFPLHALFFKRAPVSLVMLMALVVVTQLSTVTSKACCQGSHDIAGANLVIVAEELWFVLLYPTVVFLLASRGIEAVVIGLLAAGVASTATGLIRLWRRGFFRDFGWPSLGLVRRIARFGARGQLGNVLWLTNLRFDFILLGALAGPAVLGIYSVASKFAELMRLVPTALNYVLYPRFAKLGPAQGASDARRLAVRATVLTLVLTPLVAAVALVGPEMIYGTAFRGAILPAEIIVLGLSVEGAAAVSSAYLLGSGRPGLNSVGMGVGAVLTVTLDLLLIPRYGAMGGAITSSVVYATTTLVLVVLTHRVSSGEGKRSSPLSSRERPYGDNILRRTADIVVASALVLITLPLLVTSALAVKVSSRGPILYKQVRAGKRGQPFEMFKFRTMIEDADTLGGAVTERDDPRVTRLGSLLRSTKIDEFPQLFNVLKGDMTLIGPRPEVFRFLSSYAPHELQILEVRPGLTGPGQIFYTVFQQPERTRGLDPESEYIDYQLHPKLALDLDYLHGRGFWRDAQILLRTLAVVLHLNMKGSAPRQCERDSIVVRAEEGR
ncbi:MAG: sugar transferase [Acidimicrobiales bacterium]